MSIVMRNRGLLAGMTAIFMLAAGAGGARQDRWEIIGPGGGGTMFFPTISPHNSSRVLVYCDMTGSYITGDAGVSWRMFNLRSTARFFAFDPVAPDTIYA